MPPVAGDETFLACIFRLVCLLSLLGCISLARDEDEGPSDCFYGPNLFSFGFVGGVFIAREGLLTISGVANIIARLATIAS